jgi:RHS repeat-associated protein
MDQRGFCKPSQECVEGDLSFNTCKWCAKAKVRSPAECKMAVVGPKQFNFVRVWKSLRIAVSGGQHRNYSGSFPDAFSAKLHICRCDTSCMLNRRFETEQLLNCRRNYLGTFAQFFERFRISKKGKKSARNEICGRLMAANHGNDRAGDYLVIRQPRTVNFGGHQGVNESAVWTGAQFLHLPDHISLQVLKASHDRRNPAGMVLKIAKDFSDVDHPRADGLRLAKASLAPPNGTAFNTALCSPLINGYTLYEYYTISQSGQQMQRFNNSGWENDNIYAGGKLLVSLAGDQQYFGDNQYYQLSDWLGTRHGQVTSDGNPAHLLEFFSLPFGETAAPVGSGIDISNLHFTGKQTDLESGNDDFRARSYDPLMGRFMSPDPHSGTILHMLNPQRWNMYSYALNNPLTFTDPTGMDAVAVNFSGMVGGLGHEGILAITSDGAATYSRFGPAAQTFGGGYGLSEPGQADITNLNVKVQFGSDGLPTADSYKALEGAVAGIEKAPASTVRLNYFKTSDAETAQLKQWMQQQHDAAGRYKLCTRNCANFTVQGLLAGHALTQGQASNLSNHPNTLFQQLIPFAADSSPHYKVTSRIVPDSVKPVDQ